MKKWLITLAAGYLAGLAVALKFRKDAGTSKLPADTKDTTVDGFISEVVDIHKVAFDGAKKFFDEHLDDVKDFDSLKAKIDKMIAGFLPEIQWRIEALKSDGEARKQEVLDLIEKSYGEKQALLQNAQAKAERFVESGSDVIQWWIAEVTKKLDTAYEKAKSDSQV